MQTNYGLVNYIVCVFFCIIFSKFVITLTTFYFNFFFRPLLIYACPVWITVSKTVTKRLHTFQNKVLRTASERLSGLLRTHKYPKNWTFKPFTLAWPNRQLLPHLSHPHFITTLANLRLQEDCIKILEELNSIWNMFQYV